MIDTVYTVYLPFSAEECRKKNIRRVPGRYHKELEPALHQARQLAKQESRPAFIVEFSDRPVVSHKIKPDGSIAWRAASRVE